MSVPPDEPVNVFFSNQGDINDRLLLKITQQYKDVLVVEREGHNGIKITMPGGPLVMSPYDTWRILAVWLIALQNLPLDMHREADVS